MIELNYERRGSGEPLVLIHGIGHRWQAWEPVIDRLAAHHDVIAIDLPGFGASPMPPAGTPYDVPNAVELLSEVFAELGAPRPHIAGNSLGGLLGLEIAARGLARSVTALAPAGFYSARDRAWALTALKAVRASGRSPQAVRAKVLRNRAVRNLGGSLLFGDPSWVTADVMEADLDAMVAAPGFDAVVTAGRGHVYAHKAPDVPITVAWGSRDRILWPRQAKRAAQLLPAARHVPLPGCGHVPMGDNPKLITQLIVETCAQSTVDKVA